MGVVNNAIRISGLEASTAGIMTSVSRIPVIEANLAGVMTSVRSAANAASAAQEAVNTLSGTVGGLVTDETKYNSTIFKYIGGDSETAKTGAEIFDMILGALYDNAGADTDYINVLQMQVEVRAVDGAENFNIMDNAKSNVVPKRSINPAGTQPFDIFKMTGYDKVKGKVCYFSRTRNGGRIWECESVANIISTSFIEYDVYLFYELKKPYSVASN